MKPLKASFDVFKLFCICPVDRSASRWMKIRNILFAILALIFMLAANVVSIAFAIKYFFTDLAGSLHGVFQAAVAIEVIYTLIVGYVIRADIQKIFSNFQFFYDSRKIF